MLIPATAATVERAHSSLKFVKNNLNYDQVIEDFARRNPRKMPLVNALG